MPPPLTAAERVAVDAARARRARCVCAEDCGEDGCVTRGQAARMRGYLALHPGREFAFDDEAGDVTVAVIVPRDPGPPQVLARSAVLGDLLDEIGAPAAESLS